MAEAWADEALSATRVSDPDEILRFRRSERHLHWAIAVPFMVCYVTAAILILVYNPNPDRPFRLIVSWLHRISGMLLAVLPVLTVFAHWRDFRTHLHNVRWGWKWTLDDVKWLLLMGPATFSPRIELPRQGKFNAGEKINFIVIMTTYPVYLVTGLLIWFAGIPFITWLVHVYMALFVATPLMLGHIFMALVNPDTRVGLSGMISGFVDRHWARHHYRHWYDLTYGHLEQAPEPDVEVTIPATGRVVLDEQPLVATVPVATTQSRPPAAWHRLPGQILAIEGGAHEW